ncbi:hypothetical protein [Leucobacter sp. BZR 635]
MIFDRRLSPDESSTVLAELQALRAVDRFHARALLQARDEIEQWHIEVDYAAETWFAANGLGETDEFRGGTRRFRGEALTYPTTVSDSLPSAVVPAFPERLSWWGGHSHGYRPIMIERIGKRSMLLTFEHGTDASMRCTMVVDRETGIVTRVMHFDSPYVMLLDIEPGKSVERRVPQSFPEPEVVYPDY